MCSFLGKTASRPILLEQGNVPEERQTRVGQVRI